MSRYIGWKLDPIFLKATRGRISSTLMIRTAVLETRGARTGAPRRNAIIYFCDGGGVVITATHAGHPHHPAWFHNLLANPDVTFGGVKMRAHVVEDPAEAETLWKLAFNVLPAFARYRREAAAAGRSVPLIRLVPA